jgi:hypothetical protein
LAEQKANAARTALADMLISKLDTVMAAAEARFVAIEARLHRAETAPEQLFCKFRADLRHEIKTTADALRAEMRVVSAAPQSIEVH